MWTAVLEDVHTTAIEAVFGSGVELLIAHPFAVIRKMPLGISLQLDHYSISRISKIKKWKTSQGFGKKIYYIGYLAWYTITIPVDLQNR